MAINIQNPATPAQTSAGSSAFKTASGQMVDGSTAGTTRENKLNTRQRGVSLDNRNLRGAPRVDHNPSADKSSAITRGRSNP